MEILEGRGVIFLHKKNGNSGEDWGLMLSEIPSVVGVWCFLEPHSAKTALDCQKKKKHTHKLKQVELAGFIVLTNKRCLLFFDEQQGAVSKRNSVSFPYRERIRMRRNFLAIPCQQTRHTQRHMSLFALASTLIGRNFLPSQNIAI